MASSTEATIVLYSTFKCFATTTCAHNTTKSESPSQNAKKHYPQPAQSTSPHLIQHDVQLVVHARQRVGQDRQRLARGPRLIRIKEEQDDVRPLGEPPHHAFEVVAAARIRPPSPPRRVGVGEVIVVDRGAGHGAVDHAGAVHHHKGIRARAGSDLAKKGHVYRGGGGGDIYGGGYISNE